MWTIVTLVTNKGTEVLGSHIADKQDNQIRSVAQLCPTLCDPMNCSTPDLPVCPSPTPGVHGDSHPLSQWCHPAISSSVVPFSSCPQSLPASVFSNESTLCMRWPKYWSFSLSIIPSKEIPGLISFRWPGWISLQSKGLSRVFSNTSNLDYKNQSHNLVTILQKKKKKTLIFPNGP